MFRVSFGRFEGDGPTGGMVCGLQILDAGGRIVNDIVPLPMGLEV